MPLMFSWKTARLSEGLVLYVTSIPELHDIKLEISDNHYRYHSNVTYHFIVQDSEWTLDRKISFHGLEKL